MNNEVHGDDVVINAVMPATDPTGLGYYIDFNDYSIGNSATFNLTPYTGLNFFQWQGALLYPVEFDYNSTYAIE